VHFFTRKKGRGSTKSPFRVPLGDLAEVEGDGGTLEKGKFQAAGASGVTMALCASFVEHGYHTRRKVNFKVAKNSDNDS